MLNDPVVHVVDDDSSLRESLGRLLEAQGFRTCMHDSAPAFLESFDPNQHACLILDLQMEGMSGLDLQRILREAGHQIPIIFVSGHADIPTAVHATKAGAVHFLEKPFRPAELIACVRSALEDDRNRRNQQDARQSCQLRLNALTAREREVVELIVQGLRSREIAERLGVTPRTIHAHRSEAMTKLGAKTIGELAAMAIEGGVNRDETSPNL